MSESGGMNVNRLTASGQNVATDVKGNITTLPVNLRPADATTALNLTWDSDNKFRSADIDANGTADVNFQYDALDAESRDPGREARRSMCRWTSRRLRTIQSAALRRLQRSDTSTQATSTNRSSAKPPVQAERWFISIATINTRSPL